MPRPPSDAPHRILRALAALLNEGAAVSIEAIATRAGLSKGGLLHHFRTRHVLLLALVEQEVARIDTRIEEIREDGGTFAAAYLTVVLQDTRDRAGARIIQLAAKDPTILDPMRAAYHRWHAALEADGLPPGQAAVVQMAADGLWMAALYGFPAPPSLEAAVDLLTRLTQPED